MSNQKNPLTNAPSRDFKYTTRLTEKLNKARSNSKTVLNLSHILNNKTLAEAALKEINLHQSAFEQQLTAQDLKTFSNKVKSLQKSFKGANIQGGITPNAIIARSRQKDIRRAQEEIHVVQAARMEKNGVIHFRTNASRKYGATHHIVSVQFLNFQAALNSSEKINNAFLNAYMKSAVKFDCDCGRHRFWYRYIASVGGFAYGNIETAFPKIRNPELTGLACKHVIRVMHTLAKNPAPLRQAVKMHLKRYQEDPNKNAKTFTKKQIEKHTHIANANKAIRKPSEKMLKEVGAFILNQLKQTGITTRQREMAKLGFRLANGEITLSDFQAASKKLLGK